MKNRKSSFIHKVILFLNIIAIFCLLLSYIATIVDPDQTWYFTFFGLAYPFILAANIIFILFWMLLRKWYFLLSIAFIIVGYKPFSRTIGLRLDSNNNHEVDSNTIKLMTWNIHHLIKLEDNGLDTANKTGVLSLIEVEQPDILGIQEFYTRSKGIFNAQDSILKILKTNYYEFNKASHNDFEATGVALFSKYPILNGSDLEIADIPSGNKAVWIDVKKGDKIFRVYSVHLASIAFHPEDYQFLNEIKTDLDTDQDIVSSKKILRRLKDAFIRRSRQVKILKAHIEKCPYPYIVMGDFNDTASSFTLAEMTKNMKNGFTERGSGFVRTYNGDFPNFQIDYILSSSQFSFKSYKVLKKPYSDHYPVRCNVTLNN